MNICLFNSTPYNAAHFFRKPSLFTDIANLVSWFEVFFGMCATSRKWNDVIKRQARIAFGIRVNALFANVTPITVPFKNAFITDPIDMRLCFSGSAPSADFSLFQRMMFYPFSAIGIVLFTVFYVVLSTISANFFRVFGLSCESGKTEFFRVGNPSGLVLLSNTFSAVFSGCFVPDIPTWIAMRAATATMFIGNGKFFEVFFFTASRTDFGECEQGQLNSVVECTHGKGRSLSSCPRSVSSTREGKTLLPHHYIIHPPLKQLQEVFV